MLQLTFNPGLTLTGFRTTRTWRALLCLRERNLVTNSWYTGIYFDGGDITWSNSSLSRTWLCNRCNHIFDVIVDVIEKLYKCTCGKALIATANPNQHYEVS